MNRTLRFGIALVLLCLVLSATSLQASSPAHEPGSINLPSSETQTRIQAASATDRINPATDLVYLGAFRLSDKESGGTSWSYGGHGMGYYPMGDPTGPADGFPGSLFAISHPYENFVSEFNIPVPVISPDKDLEDLPVAETLQPFADVTGGRQTGGLTGTTLGDIQYYPQQSVQDSAKLYWALFEYYLPPPDKPMFGWCELDLSDPDSHGLWRLDNYAASATSKYLFDIPQAWSGANTPGKGLAAGRYRLVNGGSWGPAFYATGPWNDGSPPGAPPSDDASIDAIELLKYGSDLSLRAFSHSDDWLDGAWLTVDGKSAIILAGMRAMRTAASGEEYYGVPGIDGCGYKGYHAEPYHGTILFYDPYLLAQVVQGVLQPDQVQPYAEYNVEDYMFKQGCRRGILGGVGYDRQQNLLYVLEQYVEGYYARQPIVHVWRIQDSDQAPDRTAPSVPANLQATDITTGTVEFSWDAASDDVHLAGYIVHRFGAPIATTPDIAFVDDKVNPATTYTYTLRAWDAASNRSAPSDPLVVTTLPGDDMRPPIITDFRVTDITASSAIASWRTDELATTRARYEILYSGEPITVENPALTTVHTTVLEGLIPGETYSCVPSSVDASGNSYERPGWQFSTPREGAGGYGPVLDGIGAQRTDEGQLLEFTIRADDRDNDPSGDALLYSAEGLPTGATFDQAVQLFHWWPGPGDAGIYSVIFSVTDGDQTDSEQVSVFVLDTLGGPLDLHGRSGDRTIYLDWTVNVTLPLTNTWQISYDGPTGDQPSPVSGIVSSTRTYTLTGLTNYLWYTVTLDAMVGNSSTLSDTVRVLPTDITLYLPLILKES